MNINLLHSFFLWCTLIDGGVLLLTVIVTVLFRDLAYRIQSKFYPISREAFDMTMYAGVGIMKLFWIFFNVTPLVSLYILNS